MRKMKDFGPSESLCVGEASNRHMLRRLRSFVVSDVLKGAGRGVGWGSGRRSLVTCRYLTSSVIKTVGSLCSRDESGGCPLTGRMVTGMEAT